MHMIFLAPQTGGETLFASATLAFEKLDDETKQLVLDLETVNAPGSDLDTSALNLTTDGTRRLDDIFAACVRTAWNCLLLPTLCS